MSATNVPVNFMSTHNLAQLLQHSAETNPHRPFVADPDRVESYHTMWCSVQRLAIRFAREGGPGSRLLIVAGNSIDYVRVYYAALLAGQTTVEATPHESEATYREIAAEARPWGIFTDRPGLAELLGLRLVEGGSRTDGAAVPDPGVLSRAHDAQEALASIVYTSGTTGRPKGVMLTHGNYLAVTRSILDYLELTSADRYLLLLPLHHTYGKSILHTTTEAGGSLHFFNDVKNIQGLLHTLASQQITVFAGLPFHIQLLLRWGRFGNQDLSALRKVTVSGAALSPDRITEFCRALPQVQFFFMYGLTESSTRAFYLPPRDRERKRGSVGIPISGVKVAIRDEQGRNLPPGSEGEIFLRGPNIMQGYFNSPELTREALRDGWLWTGDVGRLDEEGYLYITGRKKEIINCAGERIGAREIEEVLESHPNVMEAAVIGVPDALLGESVGAFIVEREGRGDQAELRAWCLTRLSHHKVPRYYRFVTDLPKTASGKVRKAVLAATAVV